MTKPKTLSSELVYEDGIRLWREECLLPQHDQIVARHRLELRAQEGSLILGQTEDGKLLINREYRHPTGQQVLGLPGGGIAPGETPEAAAKRELREETGYEADSFRFLGKLYAFPGSTGFLSHLFFAKGIQLNHEPSQEPYEWIETVLLSPQELMKRYYSGEPVDGMLFSALFLLGSR